LATIWVITTRSKLRLAEKDIENHKLKEESKKTIERYAIEIEELTLHTLFKH